MPDAAKLTRGELSFQVGGEKCAAVYVRPDTTEDVPCIVLAHGFGALKEGGPIRSAERFAQAGFAGLAFDYRHFGESTGEPRQLIDIGKQLEDWTAAVAFARKLDGVDADRIALWGSSFSGGHVFEIAAADQRIDAIISQAPHTDGIATLKGFGPMNNLRLTVAALADAASALAGRGRRTIPIVGPPGSTAAMNTPDAEPGYRAIYDPGFEWREDFAPAVALKLPLYSPGKKAPQVQCPVLVQVASNDAITPPAPAIKAAGKAPRGELITYAGLSHFDIYRGEHFERAVADQIAFLERHLN